MKNKAEKPHWIDREAYPRTNYPFFNHACSECGFVTPMVLEKWNGLCPKCKTQLVR